jgi:hypothetical protein
LVAMDKFHRAFFCDQGSRTGMILAAVTALTRF